MKECYLLLISTLRHCMFGILLSVLHVVYPCSQRCENHASYYRDALRYLGCMELDDIPGVCTMCVIHVCNADLCMVVCVWIDIQVCL